MRFASLFTVASIVLLGFLPLQARAIDPTPPLECLTVNTQESLLPRASFLAPEFNRLWAGLVARRLGAGAQHSLILKVLFPELSPDQLTAPMMEAALDRLSLRERADEAGDTVGVLRRRGMIEALNNRFHQDVTYAFDAVDWSQVEAVLHAVFPEGAESDRFLRPIQVQAGENVLARRMEPIQKRRIAQIFAAAVQHRANLLAAFHSMPEGQRVWDSALGPPTSFDAREGKTVLVPGDRINLGGAWGVVEVVKLLGAGGEHGVFRVKTLGPVPIDLVLKIRGEQKNWAEGDKIGEADRMRRSGIPVIDLDKLTDSYYLVEEYQLTASRSIYEAAKGIDQGKRLGQIAAFYRRYLAAGSLMVTDIKPGNLGFLPSKTRGGPERLQLADWQLLIERPGDGSYYNAKQGKADLLNKELANNFSVLAQEIWKLKNQEQRSRLISVCEKLLNDIYFKDLRANHAHEVIQEMRRQLDSEIFVHPEVLLYTKP